MVTVILEICLSGRRGVLLVTFKQIAQTRHLAGGCYCKDYPNFTGCEESFGNYTTEKQPDKRIKDE